MWITFQGHITIVLCFVNIKLLRNNATLVITNIHVSPCLLLTCLTTPSSLLVNNINKTEEHHNSHHTVKLLEANSEPSRAHCNTQWNIVIIKENKNGLTKVLS